jgi:hypothetical protein
MKVMSGAAPGERPAMSDTTFKPENAAEQVPAAGAALGSSASVNAPMTDQTSRAAAKATGPQFITVNGIVYSWSKADNTDVTTLTKLGTTTSSLAHTGAAAPHTVYVGQSPDTVYVVDDEDAVQAFSRLTRVYRGETYVMVASEIPAFGQWPTLPSGFAPPTSADGGPTFVVGATDSSGVQTYRRAIATGTDGIAIAPLTDTGTLQNNPNWTWWTPTR